MLIVKSFKKAYLESSSIFYKSSTRNRKMASHYLKIYFDIRDTVTAIFSGFFFKQINTTFILQYDLSVQCSRAICCLNKTNFVQYKLFMELTVGLDMESKIILWMYKLSPEPGFSFLQL